MLFVLEDGMEKVYAQGTLVDPWLSLEANLMILLLSLEFQGG